MHIQRKTHKEEEKICLNLNLINFNRKLFAALPTRICKKMINIRSSIAKENERKKKNVISIDKLLWIRIDI